MQEAALERMHADLVSQEKARGGAHGGLGFEKSASVKEPKSKGSKKERAFHTTTAGAVAAGHWDPWARPVEFKMKEVNRRVGGLYSMFVKGGTVHDVMESNPASSVSANAAESSSTTSATAVASGSFDWKAAIETALRSAPGRELKLKKLRKAVLSEYGRQGSSKKNASEDETPPKKIFKKRLKKIGEVVIDGKTVRLKP